MRRARYCAVPGRSCRPVSAPPLLLLGPRRGSRFDQRQEPPLTESGEKGRGQERDLRSVAELGHAALQEQRNAGRSSSTDEWAQEGDRCREEAIGNFPL